MAEEKNIVFKQASHWIKNNLQIVLNLLDIEATRTEDKRVQEIFRRCRNRIKSMALLHESLFNVEGREAVNFAEYVKGLIAALFDSYGVDREKVTLKMDVAKEAGGFAILQDAASVSRATACGLIISELVSNSLKHAFGANGKGQIHIGFHTGNSEYVLVVSDNGVGLPEDFDLKDSKKGTGLRLVSALVEQLGGRLEVDRSSGTEFRITFGA